MNKLRKQSDTTYPLFFLMVDSTDHVTGKTGLSPTVTISKNGGSFASPAGAVSEIGNGLYKVAGNATDSNTLGELWIHATGTAADPSDTAYTIVTYDPISGPVPSNMTQIDGNATNGNNATLKLKSLDIRSNDVSVSAIEVRGATGGAGISGGKAVNIIGGSAGTGGSPGGDAIYLKGGSGASVRGAGIKIVTPTGGTGIVIDASDTGGSGIEINAEGSCLYLHSGYTCVSLSSINTGSPAVLVYADGTAAPVVSIVPTSVGIQYDGSGISVRGINSSINATNGIIGDVTGDLIGSVGSLDTQAKADVNAEVKDVLETDTQAEPTGVPAAASSFKAKIGWIFARLRNKQKLTKASGVEVIYADDSVTPIGTSTDTDDTVTFTKGKMS